MVNSPLYCSNYYIGHCSTCYSLVVLCQIGQNYCSHKWDRVVLNYYLLHSSIAGRYLVMAILLWHAMNMLCHMSNKMVAYIVAYYYSNCSNPVCAHKHLYLVRCPV